MASNFTKITSSIFSLTSVYICVSSLHVNLFIKIQELLFKAFSYLARLQSGKVVLINNFLPFSDVSWFASLFRWLTEGKYYEDLPEDENGVSLFTLTVIKDRTAIQCEAKNNHNIDSKTAYITAAKGNKFSHFPNLWF